MPAKIEGDYSKYPASIRDEFPYLAGEVIELRQSWAVYSHLFMTDEKLTNMLAEYFGPLLGSYQLLLQDEIFLSIARLTDKDSATQANLSLWRLFPSVSEAKDPEFGSKVKAALESIYGKASAVRKHRHKRIAHYDLSISLKEAILPIVTFSEIREVLENVEAYLNLFYWEFEQTTMFFDILDSDDITGIAEVTAYKTKAYDRLESEGVIPILEWRKRIEK